MPPGMWLRTLWPQVWQDAARFQLAYAIGVAQPVSVLVDTFGTGKVTEEKISQAVNQVFDLRPAAL